MFALLAGITRSISDKPYIPDIKLGILKPVRECTTLVTKGSLVYLHLRATVEGQAIPIIDTYKTGKQIHFAMSSRKIIPGLVKGVLGACKGEIRRITIPPALAYGESSIDGLFPSDSTWVVDAEIVEVVDSSEY
jgi:hypothetical protein